MKKILITGAGGYIGSNAAYLFLQKGYEVVAIDNFSKGYRAPLMLLQEKFGKEKIRFYEHDLKEDVSFVFEKEKNIEAVIHYAAYCNVFESMKKPEIYFANNVFSVLNILQAMTTAGVDKFIFSSTCAVYGESEYVPLDEDHPIAPVSPYGESKRMAESIIEWYGKLKGLNYVVLRYFNVYGPRQSLSNPYTGVGAIFMSRIKNGKQPVVYEDGLQTRDFISVFDVVRANIMAMESDKADHRSINIGSGKALSVKSVAETIASLYGREDIKPDILGKFRKGDIRHCYSDTTLAKETLGFETATSFEGGMKKLIDWAETTDAKDNFDTASDMLRKKGLV